MNTFSLAQLPLRDVLAELAGNPTSQCQIKPFMEGFSLIELYDQSTPGRGQGNQRVSEFCRPPCTAEPGCWSSHCPHSGRAAHGRDRLWRNCLFFSYQMLEKPCNLQVLRFIKGTHFAGGSCWRSCVCSKNLLLNSCALQSTLPLEREKPNVMQEKPRGCKRQMECRSPAPETCVCSRSLQPGKTVRPCCSSILFWKSLISCPMVKGKYLKDLAPLFAEYIVRFGFGAEE